MSLGPFDLTGGPFLTLYVVLLVATIIAGAAIPHWLRPEGRTGRVTDPERLALLAGGHRRFVDAIVARLLTANAVVLVGRKSLLALPGAIGRSEAERRLLTVAGRQAIEWNGVERSLAPHAATAERDLIGSGLMMDDGVTGQMRFWQTTPYLVLIVFGAIKLCVGEARDRPVGFLVMLLIATFAMAMLRFAKVDRRTRAGIESLTGARTRGNRLRRAPTADETDLAVALFGTSVLAGSAWSNYHAMRSASDGGGSSGGCGSSAGGGCGGGGGGGGGGGCGGCGS